MDKFSNIINEGQSSKFKLGIDVHGVIDSMPDFFAFMSKSFISGGGEVHIITGTSWTKEVEDELESYGIKYTHHFSIYDHLIGLGIKTSGEIQFPDGTIQRKFKDEDWDGIKAEYCLKNNITLHIDDTLAYNEYFTTPFARIWTHNNHPKSPHRDIRHMY